MSEIDDLKEKLKEYTEREDEHSLLPRVLLALLENGRRNEEKIANLADALSQAESKAAEHRTGLEGELKAMRSLVEQTGKETVDSIAESLSQAKSAAAERHTESMNESKTAQTGIGKLRKTVIWGGIFLAAAIPAIIVTVLWVW